MAAQSPHSSRFAELVEALKVEYDRLSNENAGFKGIRSEWSRKVEEQATELNAMLNEIRDLERKHQVVKEQYEAEIMRLKGQTPATAPSQQPPSIPPTSQLPNTATNPAKRRAPGAPPLPDSTSQIPSYTPNLPPDQALPGMFASHSMPAHPLPSQQPQPSNSSRLLGISSLPSAPPVGPAPASIPAINPAGPSAMRSVAASPSLNKMHPMGNLIPPNGTASRDPNTLHTIKKDPSLSITQSMPGGALGPAATSNGPFAANRTTMPSQPNPTAPSANEDDWKVYQGRSANGSLVNMKVSLQNSLPLDSVVCCVRYSWDGQFLATGSNRAAHIFDASSGQSVATFSKDTGTEREDGSSTDSYVRAVCFSPDGNWLITGAEDHVVKVWDVRNRKVKHRLVGHDTDIYSVDASANSQFIISGSGDKKAKLWSLESGKLLSTLGEEYGPTDGITSVSVSPTSQHVAAGSLDKVVRVWDVESSRLVRQFEGHRDSVYSVAFSPDGRMLLSGSLDKTLKLWDLAASQPSSQCRLSFTGHKDFVLSVAFSPNGRWLISGSKDRTVQFWDPRQSTMCLLLQGHKNSVISIAHNPASKCLATGSGDCRARTWLYS